MTTTPARVMIFLDYQNVYMGARSCFHDRYAPHFEGQVNPLALGELLTHDSPHDRELTHVRIYRGLPSATRDSKGYGAARQQIAAWRSLDSRISVFPRPLSYPRGWPDKSAPGELPREKGIDVSLAIDFVMLAVEGAYDVGVLMSVDTDLKPALEAVTRLAGRPYPRAEVAAWSGDQMHNRRLSISTAKLWCHWLDKNAYETVRDDTDYSEPPEPAPEPSD